MLSTLLGQIRCAISSVVASKDRYAKGISSILVLSCLAISLCGCGGGGGGSGSGSNSGVNVSLGNEDDCAGGNAIDPATGQLIGADTAEQTWNYFKSKGFTDEATAGILGNMKKDSGLDPTLIQGDSAGICQWGNYNDNSGGWKELYDYAQTRGQDWTDLLTQLEFIVKGPIEIDDAAIQTAQQNSGIPAPMFNLGVQYIQNSGSSVDLIDAFKSMSDVDAATAVFAAYFNRSDVDERKAFAHEFFEQYKGTSAGGSKSLTSLATCTVENQAAALAISQGDQYAQFQGFHYHQADRDGSKDDEVKKRGCGATAVTVATNILLAKQHEYCNVEVWHWFYDNFPDYHSTAVGWNKLIPGDVEQWLFTECLHTQIKVVAVQEINDRTALERYLNAGCVCCVSSQGLNDGYSVFKNKDGSNRGSNGHYVLFYKLENGTFYANDGAVEEAGGGIAYTADDIDKFFSVPNRQGGSVALGLQNANVGGTPNARGTL